jgi:hypothetical protein
VTLRLDLAAELPFRSAMRVLLDSIIEALQKTYIGQMTHLYDTSFLSLYGLEEESSKRVS